MVIKILSKGFQGKIINYVQNDLINPHRGTWKIMKRKTKWSPNKVNFFKKHNLRSPTLISPRNSTSRVEITLFSITPC